MINKIEIAGDEKYVLNALHGVPEESTTAEAQSTLIIMSHGFPGHKADNDDIFGALEHILVKKDCHTLRFDYRGCGHSDGQQQDFNLAAAAEDFKHVIHWAKEQGYLEFIFIGEGLGATLCIMNTDIDVKMMALLWPVLDMKSYAKNVFGVQSSSSEHAVLKGYIESNNHRVGLPLLKELRQNDLEYALKEMYMPVLLIQGAQDEILPMEQLDIARKHMRSKRMEVTTFHDGEYGLRKESHRKMIYYHLTQFVEKYI